MKKLLPFLFMLLTLGASAQSYGYLTFKTTSGAQKSLAMSNLVITFEGGNMIATNDKETATYAVSELSSMFFASTPAAIKNVSLNQASAIKEGTIVKVFNVAGQLVKQFENNACSNIHNLNLPKGVYIIQADGKAMKLNVQ